MIVVDRYPGSSLHHFDSYGFKEHISKYGSGENRLHTRRFAQVGALKNGDILITGDKVLSDPREGGNGSVLLCLPKGEESYEWLGVPARIPIELLISTESSEPKTLHEGDVLATGDEVLIEPSYLEEKVYLRLTGGFEGHNISVPARIPIAVLTRKDRPPKELWKMHFLDRPAGYARHLKRCRL